MNTKVFPFMLALIVSSCVPTKYHEGASGIGDSYFPQLGNAGYDALHYALNLDIEPQANSLTGDCTVEILATQSLSSFNFDFSGLEVDQIYVDGMKADFMRNEAELTIRPPQSLQKGEDYSVQILYHGSPEPVRAQGASFDVGWFHNPKDEIYVTSETSGAETWYPVNDHPLDKASYRFQITVPKPYVVAANGLLMDVVDHGERVTYVWESPELIASYLTTINVAEYVVETETGPEGLIIRNYLPADFPEDRRHGIDQIADMLGFFIDRFGAYPFSAYGTVIVDIPDERFVAMETQTLSQHETSVYALKEATIAHELAHQWFGNSVSLETWQEIWLKEGAARYAEWLWEEYSKGAEALETRVRGVYQLQAWSSHELSHPPMDNLYTDAVYDKGGLLFHALRLRVGDDVFFDILQTYLEKYRYGNASSSDFIQICQDISGQNLEEFFDSWLSVKKIPPIPEMDLTT
jgi:aminopeptidase N